MSQVLVLEDEHALRSSICRDISRTVGIDVASAAGLREAVKLLSGSPPTVVVADLSLQDGCGLDLLPELAVRGLSIPVIFITGYLAEFENELPNSASITLLQKPFESAVLCELVRQRVCTPKTLSPSPVFAFTVADYLQLAGIARRNVALTITDERGAHGRIVIEDGQVRWAGDDLGFGEEAFQRLALMSNVDVQAHPITAPDVDPNVVGSLDQLLLDAMRHADERRAGQPTTSDVSPATSEAIDGRPAPPPTPEKARGLPAVPKSVSATIERLPHISTVGEAPKSNLARTRPASQSSSEQSARKERAQKKESSVPPAKSIKPTVRIEEVLSSIPALRAAATAGADGSVLELAGEIDAETACAVATLAARQIEDAVQTLGLGELASFQVSTTKSAWYVVNDPGETVVAVGSANKNPVATLKKLAAECGG